MYTRAILVPTIEIIKDQIAYYERLPMTEYQAKLVHDLKNYQSMAEMRLYLLEKREHAGLS